MSHLGGKRTAGSFLVSQSPKEALLQKEWKFPSLEASTCFSEGVVWFALRDRDPAKCWRRSREEDRNEEPPDLDTIKHCHKQVTRTHIHTLLQVVSPQKRHFGCVLRNTKHSATLEPTSRPARTAKPCRRTSAGVQKTATQKPKNKHSTPSPPLEPFHNRQGHDRSPYQTRLLLLFLLLFLFLLLLLQSSF